MRLVREFADECDYVRRNERNVFTFTLRRAGRHGSDRSPWLERGAERRQHGGNPSFPLKLDDGQTITRDRRSDQERRALGFISQVRLFAGAKYCEVEPLVVECQRQSIAAGEVWLAPGARSAAVAIVLDGRLRIHVERPDTTPTFIIEPGHCAGEMQLLDGKPASAYVIADVDSTLLLVPAAMLRERMLAIPQVASNLLAILAGRIRRSDRVIADQVRAAMELERLQREIRLAQDIQVSMLPAPPLFPDLPQIGCAGYMHPAKQVGGDFYDAFQLDTSRVFLAIGDICGKGLPSALFMVRTLTTLWNEATPRRSIQRIVDSANRHLCVNNDTGLFVSLFCGIYDLASRQLTFVNAGHNPPLVSLAGEPFHFLEAPRNLVAGISGQIAFRAGSIQLQPGSRLLLYTDGVTESESRDHQWFGEQRLLETAERNRDRRPVELTQELIRAVDVFTDGADQADDLTLLAFCVNA
jgi:serine phosphatase RsbU (regulator of sigma subunit)